MSLNLYATQNWHCNLFENFLAVFLFLFCFLLLSFIKMRIPNSMNNRFYMVLNVKRV